VLFCETLPCAVPCVCGAFTIGVPAFVGEGLGVSLEDVVCWMGWVGEERVREEEGLREEERGREEAEKVVVEGAGAVVVVKGLTEAGVCTCVVDGTLGFP
jgi:hypothetical protein